MFEDILQERWMNLKFRLPVAPFAIYHYSFHSIQTGEYGSSRLSGETHEGE